MADTTAGDAATGDGRALTGDGAVDLSSTRVANRGAFRRFQEATEIDTRLVGMVAALVAIWVGFHLYGEFFRNGGYFLTPRNLWFLTVQTASIGIMATGMVLVIVTRHIDLSVGSLLGLCAMTMGVFQVQILPEIAGYGASWAWAPTILVGLTVGTLVGAFHGWLIAYLRIPAFIVTLGGLLVWNGVAYLLARGETLPFTNNVYKSLGGGGLNGSVGATWSWLLGIAAVVGLGALIWYGRRQRARFGFGQRPVWGEWTLFAIGAAVVVGFVVLVNSYTLPRGLQRQYARAEGIDIPEGGLEISYGFAIPVLILVAVGIVMTFLATKTRFGRYVFAIGGNPEAAELAGIDTRWVTLKIFALLGLPVRPVRRRRLRAPGLGDQPARHARRALRDRRRRDRRHLARGRARHDLRRHHRRAAHAIAADRHGPRRLRCRAAARRRRLRAGARGVHRHLLPEAHAMSPSANPAAAHAPLPETPMVEMRDISIAFGGIKAVDHASVALHRGEVVALLGHNGAGKSTLIKVLSGAYARDTGEILIDGEVASASTTRATPSASASRRSTRRSRSPTTWTPPPTSISAARSSPPSARSTRARWRPTRAR